MTQAVDILARLEGVKSAGDGKWMALCPAHDDATPSLSIALADDGRLLLHCHAGCTPEAVCAALRLTMADLFPPRAAGPRSKGFSGCRAVKKYFTPEEAMSAIARQVGGSPAGCWPYLTADGTEAFRVLRFDLPNGNGDGKVRKTFRPIHPVAEGWAEGDPIGPLPLYRLGELEGAGPVHVCEGEKCADAAWSIGLVATTSAHGAKSAAKSDWRPLAGREVIVLPDNDVAGRGYAQDVARTLTRLQPPARVKIVELCGLPEGGDIVDWLEGWDAHEPEDIRAEMERLIAAAPYREAKEVEAGECEAEAVVVTVADVQAEPVRWLWPDRIPLGKVTLLAGNPDVGKSFLTLDIAARVSGGFGWPDCPKIGSEVGDVVILSAEDDVADTIRPRLEAAGADLTRVHVLSHVNHLDANTGRKTQSCFCLETDLPALEGALRNHPGVRLLVIDPITAYLGRADSHRNAEIRGLLAPLAALAARREVAVVAVTHLNKNASGSAMYRAMGSLAFAAMARAYWLVTRDCADPEQRLLLPVKCNLVPAQTGLGFRLKSCPAIHEQPVVLWEPEPVVMTADEALATASGGAEERSAIEEATEWLREVLADGPVAAKDMTRRVEEDGLKRPTVLRAAKLVGVEHRREGGLGAQGAWSWFLPDKARLSCAEMPNVLNPEAEQHSASCAS